LNAYLKSPAICAKRFAVRPVAVAVNLTAVTGNNKYA